MTTEELKQAIAELEERFKSEKTKLYSKYLNENNSVKKGDVVSDGENTIKVDRITYTFGLDGVPYCLYYGKWLTQKGAINKRGEQICISQPQILTHETN